MNYTNSFCNNVQLSFGRRSFLKQCGLGIASLSLVNLLDAAQPLHHAPKAKRVIHLFLHGGPSHLDTFDYKPEVNSKDGVTEGGGQIMGSPFKWEKAAGTDIWLPEIFPNLKSVAGHLCVINSMNTDVPAHELATLQMHTGSTNFVRPSLGSLVTYGLGDINKNLPSFVSLRAGGGSDPTLYQSAFLPGNFQGTPVDTQQSPDKIIENIIAVKGKTQRQQLDLISKLDILQSQKNQTKDPELDTRINSFELAYKMQFEVPETFDISKETEATKAAYGNTPTGKQFLVARRLMEKGVRFVQIYNGSWDNHSDIKNAMAARGADIDKPLTALVQDLKQRGLLKDTLIIISGEFGRTTHRDGISNGFYGRGHWSRAFSAVLIGGGVKGGMVYGATDALGQNIVSDKMHIHDLHATVLHLLGFDHTKLTYRYGGRDFRLTDVEGQVAQKIIA